MLYHLVGESTPLPLSLPIQNLSPAGIAGSDIINMKLHVADMER